MTEVERLKEEVEALKERLAQMEEHIQPEEEGIKALARECSRGNWAALKEHNRRQRMRGGRT